jgi:hypothetical protein
VLGRPAGERLRPAGDPVTGPGDRPDYSTSGARRLRSAQLGAADRPRWRQPGRGARHRAAGVVLSNQSDQNLCGWLPFAKTLATRGFRALVYDYDTAADPAGNVVKAAAKLRQLGGAHGPARRGLPGRQGLIDGCAGDRPTGRRGGEPVGRAHRPGPGRAAVRRQADRPGPVHHPKGDRYGAAEATPQLYAAATKASSRRLEVVAGDAHGTDPLTGPGGAKVRSIVIGFLSKQAHSP